MLREPLLYLSLYLKQHRARYYALLDSVRRDGNWEDWLTFFLDGVAKTAGSAVETAQKLLALFEADRTTVASQGRKANAALRVHEALQRRPVTTLAQVAAVTGLTFPTVAAGMRNLIALGIASEVTGRQRNRVFSYTSYLARLNVGTESA